MGKLSILLRGERIRKCITQKTVADFVGVTEATVSRWETGDIENMRLNRLVKLAEVLRISPMEIIKLYESRGEVMDLDKYDSDELRQVGDFFTVTEHGGTLFRIMSRPTFMDMMKKSFMM